MHKTTRFVYAGCHFLLFRKTYNKELARMRQIAESPKIWIFTELEKSVASLYIKQEELKLTFSKVN